MICLPVLPSPLALCLLCLGSVTTLIKCQAQTGAICCEHASRSPKKKLLKLPSGIAGWWWWGIWQTKIDLSMERGESEKPQNPKGKESSGQKEAGDPALEEE